MCLSLQTFEPYLRFGELYSTFLCGGDVWYHFTRKILVYQYVELPLLFLEAIS